MISRLLGMLVLVGCSEAHVGDLCSREALQRMLDGADPHTSVLMGRCRIEGPIVVPDDITLVGTSNDMTADNGIFSDDGVAVVLGDHATLDNVHVVSSGDAAVLADDVWAYMEHVRIEVTDGVAIAILEGGLQATDVTAMGPVDDAMDPRFAHAAVYGVYARNARRVAFEDVHLSRFAGAGVVLEDSSLGWEYGSIRDTIGAGGIALGEATDMLLEDLTIEGISRGTRDEPSYGWIASESNLFYARRLILKNNDGVGVLGVDTRALIGSSLFENHGDVGLWIVEGRAEVFGTTFSRNTRVAAVFQGANVVGLERCMVRDTNAGDAFGDGLVITDISNAAEDVVYISDTTITNNAGGGLLLEYVYRASLSDIFVGVTDGRFGAVALARSDGELVVTRPEYWDVSIDRDERAAAIDSELSGAVDVFAEEPSGWRSHLELEPPL